MSAQTINSSRRRFFGQLAVASVGVAVVLVTTEQASAQAALPELSESDPTGAALGYRADSSKVDAAKYPNHKPDQMCSGCNLVQGNGADDLRPCAIFPGKSVRNKGWCAAFVPKPA